MKYLVALALLRSIVEGLKKVAPGLDERAVKVLVALLSVGVVVAYRLNAAAEAGLVSGYLVVDYAVSAAALWFATLVGHDIFGVISATYRGIRNRLP